MKKFWGSIGGIAVFIAVFYVLGPKPKLGSLTGDLPVVPSNLVELNAMIQKEEASVPNLKPNNEALIMWGDSAFSKTKYAVLYLPGFSGSWYEAEPLHRDFAKKFGCNLFMARLYGHGVADAEPMRDLTVEKYLESARKALAIASQLGDSVIIMSTSTGGSLSLILAAEHPEIVSSLILFSPNIRMYDARAGLLAGPWGLQIARWVKDGDYHVWETDEWMSQYWTVKYRLEALVQLQGLLEKTMNKGTYKKVSQPLFMAYYYKNEQEQDTTVSVKKMRHMFRDVSTPNNKKVDMPLPEAQAHVIACKRRSNQFTELENATFDFAENVLHLKSFGQN